MVPISGAGGSKSPNNIQKVDETDQSKDTQPVKSSWRHRIVSKIKKAVISPIKTAVHRARYNPKGSVPRPRPLHDRTITPDQIKLATSLPTPGLSPEQEKLQIVGQPLSEITSPNAEGHTNAALFSLEALHYDSALTILTLWKDTQPTGVLDAGIVALEKQIEAGKKLEYETLHLKGSNAAAKTEIKNAKKLGKQLRARLIAAGIPKSVVESSYKHHMTKQLNDRDWGIQQSTHETSAGVLEHQQVPASKMQLPSMDGAISGSRAIFETSYDQGGVSSQTTDSDKHAVNLWTSSFKTPEGKFNYQGVRHGIHSAAGIENTEKRKAANLSRAKESLVAALTLKPELLQQAVADPEKPVHLDLTSTSLVTPDPIRRGAKSEARMLQEQVEAFRELGGKQPLELTVNDASGKPTTIRVNVRLATFNFGVNVGAQGKFSGLIGGWNKSDALNKEGLKTLIGGTKPGEIKGMVGDYLTRQQNEINQLTASVANPNLPKDERSPLENKLDNLHQQQKIVRELVKQTRTIFNSKAHHHEDHDAYKMPARITLLTSLIEGVPLSNCKSGKDRTGMLDAEIKLLATMIERDGKVPEPGTKLSEADTKLFRDIVEKSKNLEIQKLNTGAEGYKTEGIKSIDEHMGKEYLSEEAFNTYRARIRGLSGGVKA